MEECCRNHVGRIGDSERHTDAQLYRSPHLPTKIAIDVSLVEQNSSTHSNQSACGRSVLHSYSATRSPEKPKHDVHKALCTQRGMAFVPAIFTASGGMGEQSQRQLWHPQWQRLGVEADDFELRIGPGPLGF